MRIVKINREKTVFGRFIPLIVKIGDQECRLVENGSASMSLDGTNNELEIILGGIKSKRFFNMENLTNEVEIEISTVGPRNLSLTYLCATLALIAPWVYLSGYLYVAIILTVIALVPIYITVYDLSSNSFKVFKVNLKKN